MAQWQALQERAAQASAQSKPVFDKRGQLLPRQRVALLLDPGAPFLPLCALAGFMQDTPDPAKSVPGGGMIAGIGFISGVRCMVVASDSGIEAGAIQARGLEKILRVQELALENKLPFVHLVESAGANKATNIIQWMCQLGHPLIYLQNTTGYMVGKDSEQGGMIKHGSKMIQAVTSATVPQITIQCGASFGAGNYGMCGRGYAPRFLFSWPGAKTAVMGGEQAARTMQIVTEAGMARKGITPDPEKMQAQFDKIVQLFEAQADAFYTSGLVLDDGVSDPRDTRRVLAFCLDTCFEAAARHPRAMPFGVARM